MLYPSMLWVIGHHPSRFRRIAGWPERATRVALSRKRYILSKRRKRDASRTVSLAPIFLPVASLCVSWSGARRGMSANAVTAVGSSQYVLVAAIQLND